MGDYDTKIVGQARNCFVQGLAKEQHPENYVQVVAVDQLLKEKQKDTMIRSPIFVSYSCKRVQDLTPLD